jgi:hypothetical protein
MPTDFEALNSQESDRKTWGLWSGNLASPPSKIPPIYRQINVQQSNFKLIFYGIKSPRSLGAVVAGCHARLLQSSFSLFFLVFFLYSLSLWKVKTQCRTSSESICVVLDPPRFMDWEPLIAICDLGHQPPTPSRELQSIQVSFHTIHHGGSCIV